MPGAEKIGHDGRLVAKIRVDRHLPVIATIVREKEAPPPLTGCSLLWKACDARVAHLTWKRLLGERCRRKGTQQAPIFETLLLCGTGTVSLSDIDRILLKRCIDGAPRAWQDFVDRFLGLVIHVANHTSEARGFQLDEATRDDLVSEVFLTLLANDRGVLRRFRRNSSLATYLTVISRRVIARRLHSAMNQPKPSGEMRNGFHSNGSPGKDASSEPETQRFENREEIERLMTRLDPQEASVVRLFHLEGKSYDEISRTVGLAENSIGPLLSRARQKMREGV